MSITEFLLARIAEDEAAAKAAAAHQKVAGPFHGNWGHDSLHLSGMERDDAKHIARHDPARVLAECAAKRAIIERHPIHVYQGLNGQDVPECAVGDGFPCTHHTRTEAISALWGHWMATGHDPLIADNNGWHRVWLEDEKL